MFLPSSLRARMCLCSIPSKAGFAPVDVCGRLRSAGHSASSCILVSPLQKFYLSHRQLHGRITRGRGFILALSVDNVADVATSAHPAPLQIRFTTPTVKSMMRWEALTPSFIYTHIACQVRANGVDNLAADITCWYAGRADGRVWSSNDSLSAIKPSYQLLSPPARVLFVLLRQRLSVIIRDNSLTRTTSSIQAIAAVASVHHVSLRRGNPYSPQHLTMATTQEDCRVGAQDLQNPPTTGPSLHRGLFQMF
ncbi:hypothetical protein C8Q70DRAFT_325287 [Cubamyces menziesii]|nr:hypothetical protein C8Q70DRAFT_325287 [Cubamyces menziesii]